MEEFKVMADQESEMVKIPEEKEIISLWNKYETPMDVRKHCLAVASLAMDMIDSLSEEEQHSYNRKLVYSAALLHDIVRIRSHHEQEGGRVLKEEGYIILGEMIACHSDFPEEKWGDPYAKETALLYLADKQIQGCKWVSLEERFAKSRIKIEKMYESNSLEAAEDKNKAFLAHKRKQDQANRIVKRFGWKFENKGMRKEDAQ